MPRNTFVDFKAVKAAITMEKVLTHYDLLDRFKRSGDSLSGPCPIHEGENPTQFRVSFSNNIWNCFSQCKGGGNVLDFISRMENVSIHGAALKAIEWFDLNPEAMTAHSDNPKESDGPKKEKETKSKPSSKKTAPAVEKITPNVPLKFCLDKLDHTHPYLEERGLIPRERIDDVVVLDPSDEEYPIGFNILSAHSELEKRLLASDLASVFKRLSSSWGDQMNSVLNNAILAFLESSQGGTLSDMRRFLLDTAFRERFLQTVSDPEVVYYWRKSFPQLGGNKSLGPLMTRLETFLGPKAIRYMVSQKENRLNFGDIMDGGKIFLAKLSQGQIGRENSYLLGSLLMSKFQQQAMSRQTLEKAQRRPFWLYVDEFPNFMSSSIAEILTGARKYNLGLILAHQELRQLQSDLDVAGAILSNAGTRIVFRVGDADAKVLAEGFASFNADSLRKLGTGEALCRVERSDFDFNLRVPLPEEKPDPIRAATTREQVIGSSRAKYATPREVVKAAEIAQFEALSAITTKPAARGGKPEPIPLPQEPVTLPPVVTILSPEPPVIPAEVTKPAALNIPPPADMGRGGAQHQSIQQRLKAVAEDLGFRAIIEKPILDGRGSVDLALEKDGFAIACEISITTTTDHEFGNVKKCLQAEFPMVAVVSSKSERLSQIEEAVKAGLPPEVHSHIGYFLPDQFIAWLRELVPTIPAPLSSPVPSERTTRGYKVRSTAAKLSEEERKTKEDIALKAIAESMKKPRKKK